jgi:uncharacterized protein YbjQ (UPF0145 family)
MDVVIELLFLFSPLLVIIFAMVLGRYLEKQHYRSIHQREHTFLPIPAVTAKSIWDDRGVQSAKVCVESVVVSVDHFKRFLAGFRIFFDGEMKSYSTLLDRGRREALLRMKAEAPDADLYLNCRLETPTL